MAKSAPSLDQASDVKSTRLRFAIVFVAVAGSLLTLYSFPYAEHGVREDWFVSYLAVYARLAGSVLRLIDHTVHVVGADIVGRVSFTVAKNCDAMDVNILFVSAIVAFPAPWSRRAVGIGAGLVLLVVINILRIVSLYFVDVHWPGAFEYLHAEIWPFAIVALAVAGFLFWSRWAQAERPGEA
jgi:exosortase/archaeosortase family protein